MTSSAKQSEVDEVSSKDFRTVRYRGTPSELTELYKIYVLVFQKSARISESELATHPAKEMAAELARQDRANHEPRSIEVFFDMMKQLMGQPSERRRVRAR